MLQDFDTWSAVYKHYLPTEYHTLFKIIDKHCETFHEMPTFESLKYEIRDSATQEKLYAIESVEVEVEPEQLLEYLKNEYAQKEILDQVDDWIDNSVAFESAEESVTHLYEIALDIEDKIDLQPPGESMAKIALFDDEEELGKYLPLGLNEDFDFQLQFSPRSLLLFGGKRGAGKSITCSNIAHYTQQRGKSAIYFTIEMDTREILHRSCSVATGVPLTRLRIKNLSVKEWETVAAWWADRFLDGQQKLKEYEDHRSFDRFHESLTKDCELLPTRQLDIIYDPSLTVSKIRAELDKRAKSMADVGVVIVDYLNQVQTHSMKTGHAGQYDWKEQIEVAKALKSMAQEYDFPFVSPYQIDGSGEARFAKGILDSADAAFTLDPHEEEDQCVSFKCVKMRNGPHKSFTSTMDWDSLKIGPESALTPVEKEELGEGTGEKINDLEEEPPWNKDKKT